MMDYIVYCCTYKDKMILSKKQSSKVALFSRRAKEDTQM